MSLVVTAACDGSWDDGRMPCRGAISAHHTVPLMDELRARAAHAGWALTVDGDYCPAHARLHSPVHSQVDDASAQAPNSGTLHP